VPGLRRQQRKASAPAISSTDRSVLPARAPRQTAGRFVKKLLSFGAMAGVGALLVSTSLPANAFQSATLDDVATPAAVEKQSVTVNATAAETAISRDGYTVVKPPPPPPPPKAKVANVSAVVGSYSYNPNGTIQWPFPSAPILSPYGPRGGTFHYGIDFFPGEGTPIGAIADGVVTYAGAGSGGWGNYVTVRHNINGQVVDSLYAHMLYGSIGVAAGQQVSVGQFLGGVGATGRAYGAHLHLEIKVNGANVDPYAWLQANAN
jgi:murein DD-endopeptidase MepM/ murein hydrolase activator NlpD